LLICYPKFVGCDETIVLSIFQSHLKEGEMNRAELVDEMAKAAGISKVKAEAALNGFIDSVGAALKKKEKVSLVGFGTFSVSERAARTGRNPRTGAVIQIPASTVPKFKPGKGLKDAIK
jgi:DNA-binding protein HU-beta